MSGVFREYASGAFNFFFYGAGKGTKQTFDTPAIYLGQYERAYQVLYGEA